MALTTAQLQALKAAAVSDPTAAAFLAAGNDTELGWWFNAEASPAFVVWRSSLTPDQSRAAIVNGAVQLDNLTAGKRDALLYLCAGSLDCRNANVRSALDDLCGTQNTLKASILAAEKRNATRAEKILATGTGSDASPATTTFEGQLGLQDVANVRMA